METNNATIILNPEVAVLSCFVFVCLFVYLFFLAVEALESQNLFIQVMEPNIPIIIVLDVQTE